MPPSAPAAPTAVGCHDAPPLHPDPLCSCALCSARYGIDRRAPGIGKIGKEPVDAQIYEAEIFVEDAGD
jgi:hypothetical protein